ncbi:uncharacterized protein LOC129753769 [Uranotaenia lowii]|uniref:uncharacterized protein LOC129753769 n=1 Tax=Uranotaenia lowii TaxID=190385 RepID=UPI00247B2999|nr:uncharacterized protein LOC129753769 [Uranotaenia lowii]
MRLKRLGNMEIYGGSSAERIGTIGDKDNDDGQEPGTHCLPSEDWLSCRGFNPSLHSGANHINGRRSHSHFESDDAIANDDEDDDEGTNAGHSHSTTSRTSLITASSTATTSARNFHRNPTTAVPSQTPSCSRMGGGGRKTSSFRRSHLHLLTTTTFITGALLTQLIVNISIGLLGRTRQRLSQSSFYSSSRNHNRLPNDGFMFVSICVTGLGAHMWDLVLLDHCRLVSNGIGGGFPNLGLYVIDRH